MKTLAGLAFAVPTALGLVAPAEAQYYYNYNQMGNFGFGSVSGPRGYSGNYNSNRIGNFTNETYDDNRGNRVNCTTTNIGSYVTTNCY